jgi:hypothetical protein
MPTQQEKKIAFSWFYCAVFFLRSFFYGFMSRYVSFICNPFVLLLGGGLVCSSLSLHVVVRDHARPGKETHTTETLLLTPKASSGNPGILIGRAKASKRPIA